MNQLVRVPISDLKSDPLNARVHSPKNIEAIKHSLTKFGQQKPIVVMPNGIVIAGNGTFAAAKELLWKEINVVVFRGSITEAKQFAVADNRSAELAEWDQDALKALLDGIDYDYKADELQIAKMVRDAMTAPAGEGDEVEAKDSFILMLELNDEKQLKKIYEEMTERGIKCKIIT